MPRHQCRAGRFGAANTELCARHTGEELPEDVLEEGIRALQHVLGRLLDDEDQNLDVLAKHIPRITSVAIQAARVRHQIGESTQSELLALLGPVLEDLDETPAGR